MQPKTWCYLVIGCASYRGYFDHQAAQRFAGTLHQQGLETSIGGAGAYSTLGWFADPLLPSMMRYGEANFAETLFHELAHQQLYINGNSAFNEAFASVVGEHGARLWLRAKSLSKPLNKSFDTSSDKPADLLTHYEAQLEAAKDFDELLDITKIRLKNLYATTQNEEKLRSNKHGIFEQLKQEYAALKEQEWDGTGWYDSWFDAPLNNARLASIATYRDQMPQLNQLLQSCGYDLARFYSSLTSVESDTDSSASNGLEIPVDCVSL